MKKTILLLSRDIDVADTVKELVATLKYSLADYHNKFNFDSMLEMQPTLIMLDVDYGELDIIELLTHLSVSGCKIPIILMGRYDETIMSSVEHIGKQKNLTIIACIKIPINQDELISSLVSSENKLHHIDAPKLVTALENKQFLLHYQPKIEIKSKKLVGVEALIRWQPPYHELISPDKFISLSEESNLIIPMTFWTITQAFSEYITWELVRNKINLSINLSSKSLTDLAFANEMTNLCAQFNLNTANVCFEVTESEAMRQPEIILEVLTKLRLRGFKLSIDDFGTGYSSLIELQRLPFTELKIDKSFIIDLEEKVTNKTIVSAIIYLARKLKLKIVAEGVESEKVLSYLGKHRCDIAQGYYIAKPMQTSEMLKWFKDNLTPDLICKHI